MEVVHSMQRGGSTQYAAWRQYTICNMEADRGGDPPSQPGRSTALRACNLNMQHNRSAQHAFSVENAVRLKSKGQVPVGQDTCRAAKGNSPNCTCSLTER
eukprot:807369-Pelagomonas_calceolata.AAC.1